MHLTLSLDPQRPWADQLERARQAEAAGWDGVRIGEIAGGRDSWARAGAIAAVVPRVRIEVVMRSEAGRHPAVVAKLAATVDQLSGGRVLAGWDRGRDRSAGGEGEARLAEACQVLRALASQPRATWTGRFYQLQDAPLDPKPVQQPFPVLLAGVSPELAARGADHWSITGSLDEVRAQMTALSDACPRIGRPREALRVSVAVPSHEDASPAAYAAEGVDEWVVDDSRSDDDPAQWQAYLRHLRSETAQLSGS